MPRNPSTGIYSRVSNSFSNPLLGEIIDPVDADAYFDDVDGGLNSLPAFTGAGTGTVDRPGADKLGDFVNIMDYGAACDGVITNISGAGVITVTGTDDTAAWALAMADATARVVRVPDGKISVIRSGTIAIASAGFAQYGKIIVGGGRGGSMIIADNQNLPLITVSDGSANVSIRGVSLLRTGKAVSGGDGIKYLGAASYGILDDLIVARHWRGAVFGPNGYGIFQNSRVADNQSHAVEFFCTAGGALQWQLNQILADSNGGDGFLVDTAGATGTTAIGNWTGISTFANSGAGIRLLGHSGKKLASFRLTNAFLGLDGGGGLYMDTYDVLPDGIQANQLDQVFNEGSGLSTTGPGDNTTAATNNVPGFKFTSNVGLVQISNSFTRDNARDGFYSEANKIIISNTFSNNNGVSGTAGQRNGFNIVAGSAQITNSVASNDPSSATQAYGINLGAGASASIIIGNDLSFSSGNATAGILVSSSGHTIQDNKGATDSAADENLNMNNNAIVQIGSASFNGAVSGSTAVIASNAATGTLILPAPAASDTFSALGLTETFTGVKTFGSAGAVGRLKIAGNTSGTITLNATATAGTNTLTLPAATDTVAVLAASQAFTNKTYNGLTITSTTGTLTMPSGVTLTGPAASGTAMTLGNTETSTGIKTFKQPDDATIQSGTKFQRFTNDSQVIFGYEPGSGSMTIDSTFGSTGAYLPLTFRTNDTVRLKVDTTAGATGITATLPISTTGKLHAFSGTAVPAGGTTGSGILLSSTANLGVFFGSGAPSLSAAQGSLYIRTDGSSTSTRLYVNTNGSTTWTNVTTAA